MHYGARLAAATDTSVRQMLSAFSPLLTIDFEIHPAVALYDETHSKTRPSTWPEYDNLLEEIFPSGKEAEAGRGIVEKFPEVGVELATATDRTVPSESLLGRTRAQRIYSTPDHFEAQATLPNQAHSSPPTPPVASTYPVPRNTDPCSEATQTTTKTRKREHDCQDECTPTKKQRTGPRSLTIEKPILPHPSFKQNQTSDRKRKLEDQDNHTTATKKQRKNPGSPNNERPFPHSPSSEINKDTNLKRKSEDNNAKDTGIKGRKEDQESLTIEKPLSPPVLSQPATTTPLKRKLDVLDIERESRKKQCTSLPNDPVESSAADDSGIAPPTKSSPSQASPKLTLSNTSAAANSAYESLDHTVADSPISGVSQSTLTEPRTLNVLDERVIIDASTLGHPYESSSSSASLSTLTSQDPKSWPRANTLDPNSKTNTPSTPANQQTDAVTNIPGLGRLCGVQGRGMLSSLLDLGFSPDFHVLEESAFYYPSPRTNSNISESSNDWQSSGRYNFPIPPTVAESPMFRPGPSFINNLSDFGSSTNPLRLATQSYEYPMSNPLAYGTPNNPVHQEPQTADQTDQPDQTESHHPTNPLTSDDLSAIDPRLLALDNPSSSPFYDPAPSSAPLLSEHPLFSSPQSPTTPSSQPLDHQNAPTSLPQYSQIFSPQSAMISEKQPLPWLLQKQVSTLLPISSRTPKPPIDDSYDDDDFRISSAETTARELKLRAGKVLTQYQVRRRKLQAPPSKLRSVVTVITDEEKRFMAELEHELEQELEREMEYEVPVNMNRKRRSCDSEDDASEHSAKRSRRC
ncbi:hypothetical protein IFR05_013841 [Cadophora sp. M221]|nr:hypothetical protein IFR05_013841 [Cadophora sp. M221]